MPIKVISYSVHERNVGRAKRAESIDGAWDAPYSAKVHYFAG